MGGDKIEYSGDKSTRTAKMTKAKNLTNSTISAQGARFLVIYINFFNLNTPFGRNEYMVIKLSSFHHNLIDDYNLLELAHDGRVYIKIQK
jgi:hypothetical protein